MELTDFRSYAIPIANNYKIPSFQESHPLSELKHVEPMSLGAAASGTPWAMIAQMAAANVGGFIAGLNPGITSEDMLMDAGRSNSSINGVGYEVQNNIDADRIKKDYDRSNVSKIFTGNIGGFVGGLFGRSKLKDEIETANYIASNTNRVNQNSAMSRGMRMDFYKQYGNPESQVLYADNGIDPRAQINKRNMKLTQTKDGFMFAPHNAYGKGGEVVGNLAEQRWDVIKGDKKDNKPLSVEDGDSVITDKFGLAEEAIPSVLAIKSINDALDRLQVGINSQKSEKSKQIAENVAKAQMNDLEQERDMHNKKLGKITEAQIALRNAGYLPQETVGYPHAANGLEWGNLFTGLAGIATGLGQFLQAHGSRVKRPYTYSPNLYGNRALEEASSLSVDTKPIIDQIDRESAAGRYRTMTAGGLSGAQRYLANVANIRNTQIAKADALAKADLQNNQYRSNYAQMLATLGAQDATARMQTNQWDLDYYSKAHAARQQGMQMGIYNMLNSLQQYTANANKYNMYKGMYNLYASELTDEQRKILAKLS